MLIQIPIFIIGIITCYLFNSPKNKYAKYAPHIGLFSQIFWIISTIKTGQWGIFALSIVFAGLYVKGVLNEK